MAPSGTHSRWVFTLNNYHEEAQDNVRSFLSNSSRVKYGVFGREVGQSGTPHLQGFLILVAPQRLSYLRLRLSGFAHYEPARGTSAQARDYCKKDGDFEEFGSFPDRGGQRNDLEELLDWIDGFTAANGRPPSSPDFARDQPRAYLRYPRIRALAAHRAPARQLEFGEPDRQWQRDLADELETDADDRSITFIVDPEGGNGKTWFCRYMLTKRNDVQVLGIGKKHDLAHMVSETNSVFLFNVPRGQMDFLSYALLEALKDRLVVSTKYSGSTKMWTKNNHVIVFSNEQPDYNKLTSDRYNVITIS